MGVLMWYAASRWDRKKRFSASLGGAVATSPGVVLADCTGVEKRAESDSSESSDQFSSDASVLGGDGVRCSPAEDTRRPLGNMTRTLRKGVPIAEKDCAFGSVMCAVDSLRRSRLYAGPGSSSLSSSCCCCSLLRFKDSSASIGSDSRERSITSSSCLLTSALDGSRIFLCMRSSIKAALSSDTGSE